MCTLAMPVNPYQLFGLPACRTARHHMRRALLDVFPCRFQYLVAHASCPIPGPISGQAVLSGGGAHPPCRHEKCRTTSPTENPRFRNCTRNSGDAAGGGNARQAPDGYCQEAARETRYGQRSPTAPACSRETLSDPGVTAPQGGSASS